MQPSPLFHLANVCRAIESGAHQCALREMASATTLAMSEQHESGGGETLALVQAFESMLAHMLRKEQSLTRNLDAISSQAQELERHKAKLDQQKKRLVADLAQQLSARRMIGQSAAIQDLQQQIQRVAATTATVLITGETGTGKGLVAHILHYTGSRAKGPLVMVNCAAIPENLLESELFGIEKGVASGVNARHGRFEQASGGTLFLDEIGDMSLENQSKILHALESGTVERVGGRDSIPVDVRLVAATHRNLEQRIEQGVFRQDLFFRLHVLTLHIPPLRERHGDVPLLARHFLLDCAHRHGLPPPQIHPQAQRLLESYPWPGNVRELQNEIERACIMAQGGVILPKDMPSPLHCHASRQPSEKSAQGMPSSCSASPTEVAELVEALRSSGGNKTKAAVLLGITREGLRKRCQRLQKLGLWQEH